MNRRILFALPVWYVVCAVAAADELPVPPDRVVGTVYGRPITAADVELTKPVDVSLKFDARDPEWELMGRIMTAFGRPIVDHFVQDRKIEVTEEELKRFHDVSRRRSEDSLRIWEAELARTKKDLENPDLSDAERAKLRADAAMYEKFVAVTQQSLTGNVRRDEFATGLMRAWKTERELYRAYGGRAIFQQFGPEALDARRKLFEEAEKRGDLKFDDPGVRHLFYYYANMQHPGGAQDGKLFDETPWFFAEPQ